jgi:putative sterol carrier protein
MYADEVDPATTDPREYARLVRDTPTGRLRDLMHGSRRTAVLDELFSQMPGVFRADRAAGLEAVVHWSVGDRPDGGVDRYQMVIANGTCELSAVPDRQPRLTLALGAVDFLQLVTGNAHAVALVMRGKLKTTGDLGLTMRFPNLFDPPRV